MTSLIFVAGGCMRTKILLIVLEGILPLLLQVGVSILKKLSDNDNLSEKEIDSAKKDSEKLQESVEKIAVVKRKLAEKVPVAEASKRSILDRIRDAAKKSTGNLS